MAVTQMWVHGDALAIDAPGGLVSLFAGVWQRTGDVDRGPGAQFNVHRDWATWVHLALPTPAVIGGVRARLLRVFFLFEIAQPGSEIVGEFDEVRVFDGHNWCKIIRLSTRCSARTLCTPTR